MSDMETLIIIFGLALIIAFLVYRHSAKKKNDTFDTDKYLEKVFGYSRAELNQPRVKTKMTLKIFWDIIDKTKTETNDVETQVNNFKSQLRQLNPEQIIEFDNRFKELKNKAHRWDLWGAIYLLNGGCSDDTFEYFKEWLIGQGKDKYNTTIKNPEMIMDFVGINRDWEGLGYCANEIYTEKTTKKFMPGDSTYKERPTGQEWTEDELPQMFPIIWAAVK